MLSYRYEPFPGSGELSRKKYGPKVTSYDVVAKFNGLKGSIMMDPLAIARLIATSLNKLCSVFSAILPIILINIDLYEMQIINFTIELDDLGKV